MKKFFLFAIISLVFASPAFAGKILTINFSVIEEKSIAAKDLTIKIEKKQAKLKEKIEETQKKFQTKLEQLQKQKSILPENEFQIKQVALQKEISSAESSIQNEAAQIDEHGKAALNEVNNKIKEIAAKIAKRDSADVVIPSNLVLFSSSENDITDEVLSELNKTLKNVDIK